MIKSINIKAFRNIKDKVYNCCDENNIFTGNNTAGKTNTLNAIYWCLTGCDLNGSVDNSLNIPYGEDEAKVTLELKTGTITRFVNKPYLKTIVTIDGIEYGSKTAENKIDELLGISELAKYDNTKFKVRRFLLNPNYYQSVNQSDFRKWLISVLFKDETEEKIIKYSKTLSDITKKLVLTGESLSSMSSNAVKQIKALKAQIDKNKAIQDFLQSKCITAYNDELAEDTKKCKKELLKAEELSVAIDEAAIEVLKYYESSLNYNVVGITLLEKGNDDNTWKEVCYPKTFIENIPFSVGSTAEKIVISIQFINAIETIALPHVLPKLIDEGETLDKKSLNYLTSVCKQQLFITKVAFDKVEGIKLC